MIPTTREFPSRASPPASRRRRTYALAEFPLSPRAAPRALDPRGRNGRKYPAARGSERKRERADAPARAEIKKEPRALPREAPRRTRAGGRPEHACAPADYAIKETREGAGGPERTVAAGREARGSLHRGPYACGPRRNRRSVRVRTRPRWLPRSGSFGGGGAISRRARQPVAPRGMRGALRACVLTSFRAARAAPLLRAALYARRFLFNPGALRPIGACARREVVECQN